MGIAERPGALALAHRGLDGSVVANTGYCPAEAASVLHGNRNRSPSLGQRPRRGAQKRSCGLRCPSGPWRFKASSVGIAPRQGPGHAPGRGGHLAGHQVLLQTPPRRPSHSVLSAHLGRPQRLSRAGSRNSGRRARGDQPGTYADAITGRGRGYHHTGSFTL